MTKFKNVFLLAAMAVSAVCVSSCGDDKEPSAEPSAAFDGKITATVSTDGVTVERLLAQDGSELLKTGKYENGTLTIELLNPLPGEQLSGLSELGAPNVKGFLLKGFIAISGDKTVGYFGHQNDDESVRAIYVYVAEDTTISEISLKRGWNRAFVINSTVPTVADPGGMKWVFRKSNN